MNQREFELISRKMERRFGKIDKGGEGIHGPVLFPMEGNLLKVHRKYPESNSRRLREAIFLVLHRVNGYLLNSQQDCERFENADNIRLRDALLMAFDPFFNEEINDVLTSDFKMDLSDSSVLESYFREPVLCIQRILDSVDLWEKRQGSDGYFQFLEEWLGKKVEHDDKMNYAVLAGAEASGLLDE